MLEKLNLFLESLKERPLNSLRNNLNLLIIIPALLGGMWQLFQLSLIDLSFVRFFSISQIVADGLIILVVIISYLFFFLTYFIQYNGLSIIYKIKTKSILSCYLIFFVCVFLVFLDKMDFLSLIRPATSMRLVSIILINGIVSLIVIKNISYLMNLKEKGANFVILTTLYITIQVCSLWLLMEKISEKCLLPSNLVNIEMLEKKLLLKNPKAKIKLEYFNDKFLFFSVEKDKHIIVPFEDLNDID